MNPADLKQVVNARIEALAFAERTPANLYEPIHYILSLGGKRLRPILTMLAYHAVNQEAPEKALDMGLALEIFHNFTLIHDDIMDRAPVRRGKPTAHTVWDENTAILSGDAMYAYSIGMAVKDFPAHAGPLAQAFSDIGLEVCEGQMDDMDLAAGIDVSLPRYLDMIRKKTAVLLGGCMRMGSIAAGANPAVTTGMYRFGELLGIAFQLQDDLLDAFPTKDFGKQPGGDILENKQTYLLLKAKALAEGDQKTRLDHWLNRDDAPEEKVKAVCALYEEIGIPEITQQEIDSYFQQASELGNYLEKFIHMDALRTFLAYVAKREI